MEAIRAVAKLSLEGLAQGVGTDDRPSLSFMAYLGNFVIPPHWTSYRHNNRHFDSAVEYLVVDLLGYRNDSKLLSLQNVRLP